MFNRQKAASAAQSVVDHLLLTEHVKALQEGQKSLADGIKSLGDRIRDLEKDMVVVRAEARYEATKEAQGIVISVQGGAQPTNGGHGGKDRDGAGRTSFPRNHGRVDAATPHELARGQGV